MATIAQSPTLRRPATVTAAGALLVILGLGALLPVPGMEDIPRAILLVGYAFAALKLVAAAGLWWCKKWAAILGFVVVLIDALSAAPGLFDAPTAVLQVYIIVGLAMSLAVLVLLVLRASRQAYA